jgi:hypothetical protein
VNIQKYVPGILTQKFGLDEYFSIVHPQVTFNISSICKFINSQFILKTRREMMPEAWKSQPTLKLRGKSSFLLFLPVRSARMGRQLFNFPQAREGTILRTSGAFSPLIFILGPTSK